MRSSRSRYETLKLVIWFIREGAKRERWMRVGAFTLIIIVLVVASAVAGWFGVFSSAQRRLDRQLLDPATRLEATIALSNQFADEIISGSPTVAGPQGEQTCPAAWASRASTVVSGLTTTEAGKAMMLARRRFGSAGWRLVSSSHDAANPRFLGQRRPGLQVEIVQHVGGTTSTLEVILTVPCPLKSSGPVSQRVPSRSAQATAVAVSGGLVRV